MARIRFILLCDDVRREGNGKELLIGVYAGGIRFYGEGPGKLRQLCIRLEFEQSGDNPETVFSLEITSPSGAKVINLQGHTIATANNKRGAVVISHLDLVLYEAGAYLIKAMADDNEYLDTVDVSFEQPQRAS